MSLSSNKRPTSKSAFVAEFGGVYEHSPWIAEASWDACQQVGSAEELAEAMAATVNAASDADKLALIRAHPDLAGRLAVAGELTAESSTEQASAGLDQCSADEFAQFQELNKAYTEKFAFPFVMAVRGSHRADILKAFAERLGNSHELEFTTAINEIHKIARMRIEQLWQ